MSFGLTSTGLVIKRASDIKTELENAYKATFGQAINLDARAIAGQIIGIHTEREALIWELIEEIYNSQYPDTSEGVPLDNVVAITGTTRKPSTKSVGFATLIGDAGTVIPAGSILSVANNEESRFVTDIQGIIAAGTNEQQTLTFSKVPTEGSFKLSYNGEETTALDETTLAEDIESALEALDGIDMCAVSGDFSTGFLIIFQGDNGLSPQPMLVVSSNLLKTTEQGTIQTVADSSGSLNQTWFRINEAAGSIGFWIDVDDSGSTIPSGAAAMDRAVEITTIATGDSADTVATKVAAAILADAAIASASAVGSLISYIVSAAGALADFVDGDTGFTFATTEQGQGVGGVTSLVLEAVAGVYPKIVVPVTAEVAGAIQAPSGTLTVIETPISGWDSCTNELDIEIGTDTETDQELKVRRLNEIAIAGKATLEAIRAAILAMDEVTAVVVFQNKSSIVDSEGRPPKSLDIVVENGDEDEVAEKIFDVIASGIETIGLITKQVTDSQGFQQTIKFSRPDEVPIYCEVDLTVDSNLFPANGEEQVRDLIVAYGNSLGIGVDVIVYIQLVCSFASVPGILDVAIRIGTSAIPAAGSAVVTASNDAGELLLTSATHGLIDGNRVKFTTTGTLPNGLSTGVTYHIISSTLNTFKVSTVRDGDSVAYGTAGTGVQTVVFGGYDDNIIIEPREIAKFDTSRTTVVTI